MSNRLVLDKVACSTVLMELASATHPQAGQLYARLMGVWGNRPDRERVTFDLTDGDLAALNQLNLPEHILSPDMVQSGWRVTYRDPKHPKTEVVVTTSIKPPKRRTFTVRGGKHRLTAVEVEVIHPNQEAAVATKTRKKKNTKAVDEDELDELEALEDLDDLDDEDEVDEEEPDDEEEDEDEEPAPKARRGKAKKAAPKKSTKKAAPVDEDEDEDEDEDDDEDEPAPRKRGKTRQSTAKTKSKSSGTKRQPPAPRPLPKGKLSPQDIAEMADVDARYVRVFLRSHPDEFPKDEESFRYAFGKKDAQRLVKAIKKQRASDD